MYSSQLHYIPLALPFFLFLAGLLLFLVVLIQIQVLQYAYSKLGLSSGAALLLLLVSLIGSYFQHPHYRASGACGQVWSSDRLFRHALRCAFGDRLA